MVKYLIIGNINAVTYKEIFPLIKENDMRLGYSWDVTLSSVNTDKTVACGWYTNMTVVNRKPLKLAKTYNPDDYPKYDNYDAINVDKTVDIPMDYDGVMGVPISFLDKYNPEQFEIIGFFNNYNPKTADIKLGMIYGEAVNVKSTTSLFRGPVVSGEAKYFRILIRHKR